MDKIRTKLAALAGHSAVAAEVDRRIAEQAAARIDAITARLDVLRPSVLTDPAAEDEYQRLVDERGRLMEVVGGSAK
jgi:hypothetical protein